MASSSVFIAVVLWIFLTQHCVQSQKLGISGVESDVLSLVNVVNPTTTTLQSILPQIKTLSVVSACGIFNDMQIPFSQFNGVYYVVNASGVGGPPAYSCVSATYSNNIANSAQLNSSIIIWSLNHTNYIQSVYTWTETPVGQALAVELSDPTVIHQIIRVAYIENVGHGLVFCKVLGTCCDTITLNILTKDPNPTQDVINQLLYQAQENFVPISVWYPVIQTNCPPIPTNTFVPLSVLPVQLPVASEL